MNLTTITEISREMNISTRTLRYYEQIGLIESVKKDDYAYRTYDEATVTRLQQILVLRKLRIPLKQIALILQSENTAAIIDAFQKNLNEVDDEITALSTIRDIINAFITRLKDSINQDIKLNLLDDTTLLEAMDSLTVQKLPLKEEKTAADLQAASEKLNKLTDRDVRIVYLPPMMVAACQSDNDEDNEGYCSRELSKFLFDNDLFSLKADMRSFGFNIFIEDKMAETGKASPCWEMWVSIPDDMEVPAPLFKRRFLGGLYAAHMIRIGGWDDWGKLVEWGKTSELYDFDWNPRCEPNQAYWGKRYNPVKAHMEPTLEEYLNYYNNTQNPDFNNANMQLDLLLPIKPKGAE